MGEVENDARFAHTLTDPRFRRPHIKQRKVKIDSRFKSMLKDKEFTAKVTVDKRGRPISSSTKENLERLYDYESGEDKESDDSEEDDDADEREEEEEEEEEGSDGHGSEDHEECDDEEEEDFPEITEDGPDYARGGGTLESSDDDEEDVDNQEAGDDEGGILDHNWNEPDHDAPQAEEITHRLALCNMDWDRIKVRDLYVLFNSFVPQGGALHSVTVYLSQMGKEKLEEEAKLGPKEFREGEEDGEGDGGKAGGLNRAKLRQYQLNRLKYYFAVVDFDSKETANAVYEECDSMEYEKSACRIDLRFIPDDMTFDEKVKESCTGLSDLTNFEPSTFTSTAFCQAKVEVTWDETSIDRLKKTMKVFTEEDLEKDEFDDLIASSEGESSDEEGDEDQKKGKKKSKKSQKKKVKNYRKLLGLDGGKKSKKKKKKGGKLPVFGGDDDDSADDEAAEELQLTLDTKSKKKKDRGAKNSGGKVLTKEEKSDDEDEQQEENGEMEFTWEPAVNQSRLKKKGKEKLTPWEEYQHKKKEKKKEKRKERKKEKLKEQGVEDTTDLGFNDPFFNDDSDVEGKKKKKKKEGRRKKKKHEEVSEEENEETRKEKAALGLLMKDSDDHLNHFSLEKIMKEEKEARKKKGKRRKQSDTPGTDTFEIKVDESRFGDLYTNPEMHIDPTAPEFKKTKAMMTLMGEVSKRRKRTS